LGFQLLLGDRHNNRIATRGQSTKPEVLAFLQNDVYLMDDYLRELP
jgi:hypothetical protein